MNSPRHSTVGVGVDLVSISRIRRLLDEHPTQFREFAFSERECAYCDKQADPPQHFAGRWAVKESYLKAINHDRSRPDLTTIELVTDPNPSLSLRDDGLEILSTASKRRNSSTDTADITISIAHEQSADIAIGMTFVLF